MIWSLVLFILAMILLGLSIKLHRVMTRPPSIKIDSKRLAEFLEGDRR